MIGGAANGLLALFHESHHATTTLQLAPGEFVLFPGKGIFAGLEFDLNGRATDV